MFQNTQIIRSFYYQRYTFYKPDTESIIVKWYKKIDNPTQTLPYSFNFISKTELHRHIKTKYSTEWKINSSKSKIKLIPRIESAATSGTYYCCIIFYILENKVQGLSTQEVHVHERLIFYPIILVTSQQNMQSRTKPLKSTWIAMNRQP